MLQWTMATGLPVGVVTISISEYTFDNAFSKTIIAKTEVPKEHRRTFLGQTAITMLAVLGVVPSHVPSVEAGVAVGGMMADEPGNSTSKQKSVSDQEKDIEKRIIAIIAKRFRAKERDITSETSLSDDLHADANQLGLLKRQLEKQFKLRIPKEEYKKILTVGDVIQCVQKIKKNMNPPYPNPIMPKGGCGGIRP